MNQEDYTQVTPWLNIPSRAVPYFQAALKIVKDAVGPEPSMAMMEEMEFVRIGLGGAFAHAMGYMDRDEAQAEMNSLAGAVVSAIEYSEKVAAIVAAKRAIDRAKETSNG